MNGRWIAAIVLALASAFLVGLPADSSAHSPHISLARSEPSRDTVLTASPVEIRLWFSGVPRDSATSIRLLGASGEIVSTVHVMPASPDPQDGRVQSAQIHGALAPGRYRVAWATAAQDGAEAEGEIPFTVRSR